MKFLIFAFILVINIFGCSKGTDSQPSPKTISEEDEESSNSGTVSLYGRILTIDKNSLTVIGHKQIKIWQRISELTDSDKQKYNEFNEQINPLSLRLFQDESDHYFFQFQVGNRNVDNNEIIYTSTRTIRVSLSPSGKNIMSGTSDFDGIKIVVTCLRSSEDLPCDPIFSSIIEIKNIKTPLNGKPIISAFYYSTTSAKVDAKENYKEDLALLETATFFSIVNINDTRAYAKVSMANSKSLDLTFTARKDDVGDMFLKLNSTSPELKWFRTNAFDVSNDGKQVKIGIYDSEINFNGRSRYQGNLTIHLPRAWEWVK